MKIVYVAMSKVPSRTANSIHIMKMCQAFALNGHEVILLLPNFKLSEEKGNNSIFTFYGVQECFKIIKLPWLPIKGKSQIFGIMAALKAKTIKPDLVYGRDINSCYFSVLFGLPVVFESHQPVCYSGKKFENFFAAILKKHNFKKLVVISKSLKDYYLKNYNLYNDRIIVAQDSADIPLIDDKKVVQPSTKFHVGYIGHLFPGRGIELISLLAEKCPWANFHLIGGEERDIQYWKDKICLENVIFYGFLPYYEAESYRMAFDVLIAPYQKQVYSKDRKYDTSRWMSPLKVFEYMATGKAIVCSDLPALREILEDKVDALLCHPGDLDCWVESLRLLKDNEILSESLGLAAKKKFIANYTWDKRAQNILSAVSFDS